MQTGYASVIVVNYNSLNDLERLLPSLVADAAASGYEIIIVDNASVDGSAEYVETTYPGVIVIRTRSNLGFGHANNLGARHGTGEYLAFLNPDTVVAPGWLDALIAALRVEPRAGLATSEVRLLGKPDHINTCGNDVHYTGLALCRGLGSQASPLAEDRPVEVGAVSGAAFAMRKDLFERLGGFDGDFFMYVEDTDLSWRARLAGYKSIYVPGSVVYHDYELQFGPHKTYYQERNRYLMLLKSLRWPTLLLLLPGLVLAEVVTWSFVLMRDRKRLGNKLRGYAWIARHWGEIMERRRTTQRLRRASDRALILPSTHALAYEQTGDGFAARAAGRVMNPLFQLVRSATLVLLRW